MPALSVGCVALVRHFVALSALQVINFLEEALTAGGAEDLAPPL